MNNRDSDGSLREESGAGESISPEEGRRNHILLRKALAGKLLESIAADVEAAHGCIEAENRLAAEACLKVINDNAALIPDALEQLEEVLDSYPRRPD